MKRNIVRTVFFLATLLLSLATVGLAEEKATCSTASVAGEWGYTFTGAIILSSGPVTIGVVGRSTIDAEGNVSATQTESVGGKIAEDLVKGTATVNSDCIGTLNVSVYDQTGTTLLRTATWVTVFDDHARELRALMTSLVPAGSTSGFPVVITMNGKKQFPRSGKEHGE
jgi:hypothetical protein